VQTKGDTNKRRGVTTRKTENAFLEVFLDWVVANGHAGTHDREGVEDLVRQFNAMFNSTQKEPVKIGRNDLFAALSRTGIKGRLIDLPLDDPRYLAAKRKDVVRPRVRLYDLPNQVPDYFFERTAPTHHSVWLAA